MEHSRQVQVVGDGPAASATALAALAESARVFLAGKSRLPRHKVCGEFLSPGVPDLLETLGIWQAFLDLQPAIIRRFILRAGSVEKRFDLPECGYGLSRFALDGFLRERAVLAGAETVPERLPGAPTVIATGRTAAGSAGGRLFGFKAHFSGPARDAVELFIFRGWYVGVSPIEAGLTNVCGLAPETLLRGARFNFDAMTRAAPALAERLTPLARVMPWIATGPVIFSPVPRTAADPRLYRAGDALAFIDPFTGAGMFNALLTGRLAGTAAARGTPPGVYLADCRRALDRPIRVARLIRSQLASALFPTLARLFPPALLFHLTRPA